jgi:uncharacterized protein YjbJ (UPF0337 family)
LESLGGQRCFGGRGRPCSATNRLSFELGWCWRVGLSVAAGGGLHGLEPRRRKLEADQKQIKGKVKEQWGKLTEDDLDAIDGKEQLEGKLQHPYGYQKDQAKKELNDWFGRQKW